MECERLISVDDAKLKIDSIAVVVRRRPAVDDSLVAASQTFLPDQPRAPETLYGVCVGTSDGCVTLYSVTPTVDIAGGVTPGSAIFQSAKRIHKRSLECGKAPVPRIIAETRLKETRLVCLCNGKAAMLNAETFDPIPGLTALKELDGVSLICVTQLAGGDEARATEPAAASNAATAAGKVGFAALVKQKVHLYELFDATVSQFVSSTGQALPVGDGVIQLEWTGPYILTGTKREYCVYDARTHQLHDQLVFGRAQPQALLAPLPDGNVAIRHGSNVIMWPQERGTTFESAPTVPITDDASSGTAGGGSSSALEDLITVGSCKPFVVLLHAGKVALRSAYDRGAFPAAPALPMQQSATLRAVAVCRGAAFVCSSKELFALVPCTPMEVVQRFISGGLLNRATAHYASALMPSDSDPVAARRYESGLQQVHLRCAREAVRGENVESALQHFALADCDAAEILSHFPQLCWQQGRGGGGGDGMAVQPAQSVISLSARQGGGRGGPTNDHGIAALQLIDLLKTRHRVRDDQSFQQRAVDYALLVLLVGDVIPESVLSENSRRDEIDELLLPSNNVPLDHGLALMRAISDISAASRRLLDRATILMKATHDEVDDALSIAKDKALVEEATLVLQHRPDMEQISKHMPWMLVMNAQMAVQAVCVRDANIAPNVVLSMLAGSGTSVLRQYLAFTVYENGSTEQELHTQYACALIRELEPLRGLHNTAGFRHASVLPGAEAGRYGDLRRELLLFLGGSKYYDGDVLLGTLRAAREAHAPFAEYDSANFVRDTAASDEEDDFDAPLGSSEATVNVNDFSEESVRIRLLRFYTKYNPGNIPQIDSVMDQYRPSGIAGYQELFEKLSEKYGPEPGGDEDGLTTATSLSGVTNASLARRRARRHARRQMSAWLGHEESLVHARHCDHPAVLSLFVYKLDDLQLAEQYCFSAFVTDADKRLGGSPQRRAGVSGRTGVKAGAGASQRKRGLSNASGTLGKMAAESRRAAGASASARISACLSELVVVLLIPPDGYKAREAEALRVLDVHSAVINPTSVLEAMPGDVSFKAIAPYIARVAVRNSDERTMSEVAKESLRTHIFELERIKIALHRRSVFVDRDRPCAVCKKPVGNTIIGVFPNLKVAHFRCFKSQQHDPQRGVAFSPVFEPLWVARAGQSS